MILRAQVEQQLVISNVPPTAEQQAYSESVLNLLVWDDTWLDNDYLTRLTASRPDFESKKRRLLTLLKDFRGDRLTHYCPEGCCRSRAESIHKVVEAVVDCLLCCLPPVP
eukprot:5274424-Karenia_brevis.AAC.1